MGSQREPSPLRGAVYHPGGGFHSYPPPKDRTPKRRICRNCELPADTTAPTCPVCGTAYAAPLRERIARLVRRK